jgi:hypothetical protein
MNATRRTALGFISTRVESVSALPMLQRCHTVHATFPARCICLTFGTGVSGRCVDPTSPENPASLAAPLHPTWGNLLSESW